jgi:FMN phosphatase YigB (HAD superfamily)
MAPTERTNTASTQVPAFTDARLDRVRALVERGSVKVLSLDVFDTLVWRLVPEPVDAFPLLGTHLRRLGHLRPATSPELFGTLREGAEWRARRLAGERRDTLEVSLVEVYEQLPAHLFHGATPDELAALEVDFEREITFPDLDVLAVARWAQEEHGVRVVCVSDTYYSEDQLAHILDREPISALGIERVFTSSVRGMGKGSGLYDAVLESLGVNGADVVHLGDKEDADVEAPRRAGIAAVQFDKFPAELDTVLIREGLLRADDRARPKPTLDPEEGDFGLTALRSKVLSRHEGVGFAPSINPYWRFGASVLGPVFTAFAEWVHERAADEGFDHIYCVMREGEFLTRLMNGAANYLGSSVRAEPIWLSRQVCSRAAIATASRDELSEFLSRREAPTVERFLDTLGIGLADVPTLQTVARRRLDDHALTEQVLDTLSEQAATRTAIVARAAELRSRLIDYFFRRVDAEDRRVLLVDLGWAGTIQAKLDAALAAGGADVDTVGLYLLTQEGALKRVLEGQHAEGFLASGGNPPFASEWIIRSPEILEQVCMHDEGSLVDFSPEGEPVLGEYDPRPSQVLQRTAVQRGILAFQREWGRYRPVLASRGPVDERARPLLRKMVTRFITAPTEEEAGIFASWHHDENFGSDATDTMAPADLAPALRYMTPEQFLRLPMTKVYWPFGLAELYNPQLATTAAAVAEGLFPAEAVEAADPCRASVLVDLGGGFTEATSRDVGPNTNGLCFVREDVWAAPIRNVMIRVGGGPAIVRVDWLSLSFSVKDRSEPLVVRFDAPEHFETLQHRNAVVLAPNLFLASSRPPELVYACPAEWSSEAYKVEVEVALAWMPLPALQGRAPQKLEVARHLARRVADKARNVWLASSQETHGSYRPPT